MMRKWSPNPLHRYRLTYPFGFVARNPERIPFRFSASELREVLRICWIQADRLNIFGLEDRP
jgi:hypothetical protein